MTSLHPARRADRFDALLTGDRGDLALDNRDRELLELVGALRALPEARPRPAFTASLREQLMTAAESELVAELVAVRAPNRVITADERLTIARRRHTRGERRMAAALGAFAIVGATTSMAVASQGALPGDALYPLKRAIESTHETFTAGDSAKGTLLLDHADTRLDELRSMTKDGNADASRVTEELNTFSSESSRASVLLIDDFKNTGDQSSINELRDFNASSVGALSGLEENVPDAAQPALIAAAKSLFSSDAAAAATCPACSSPGITEVPPNILASATGVFDTTQQKLSAGDALPGGASGQSQTGGSSPGGQTVPEPTSLPTLPVVPTSGPTNLPSNVPSNVPSSVSSSTPTSQVSHKATDGPLGGIKSTLSQGVGTLTGQGTSQAPSAAPSPVSSVIGSVLDGVGQVLGGGTGSDGLGSGQ